jgi:hypothetical protein
LTYFYTADEGFDRRACSFGLEPLWSNPGWDVRNSAQKEVASESASGQGSCGGKQEASVESFWDQEGELGVGATSYLKVDGAEASAVKN